MVWTRQDPGARRGYHHGNLREALIDAALNLIAQKGPAGFTFADAARSAGVSSAAPYRHFRDRDALVADVARRGFELFETRLARAWDDGKPEAFRAFENVGRAYLAFARGEGGEGLETVDMRGLIEEVSQGAVRAGAKVVVNAEPGLAATVRGAAPCV